MQKSSVDILQKMGETVNTSVCQSFETLRIKPPWRMLCLRTCKIRTSSCVLDTRTVKSVMLDVGSL